jgi:hypothetical protein
MGYWQAGDLELLTEITPFIEDVWNTDWRSIAQVMRKRLAGAIANHCIRYPERGLEPVW